MKLSNVTFTLNDKPMPHLLWCNKVPRGKRNKAAKINGVTHNELSPTSWLLASSLPYLDQGRTFRPQFKQPNQIMRSSSFIQYISTDLIEGRVSVLLKDGACYRYTNVSRRAIANFNIQDNMSVGFWVNSNCIKPSRVKCEKLYNAVPTFNGWASWSLHWGYLSSL